MGPDYSNYSFDELKQVLSGIHKSKRPERVTEILYYLEHRKPKDTQIIETTFGYRLLRSDQIPKSIPDFESRSFSYKTGDPEHLKRLFVYFISLFPVFWGILYMNDWLSTTLGELAVVLFIVNHLILILRAQHKNTFLQITFLDDRIEFTKNKSTESFALIELESITLHRSPIGGTTMYEAFELCFQGNRSVKIQNDEPYYETVLPYAQQYLSQRIDVVRATMEEEKGSSKGSLVEFFNTSPLSGLDIEVNRTSSIRD